MYAKYAKEDANIFPLGASSFMYVVYARGDNKCGAIVGRPHWRVIWNYLCLCCLFLLSHFHVRINA